MQHIIRISAGIARHPLHRMKQPIELAFAAGEQIAIVGPNGSGKTELINTLVGKYPLLMNEVEYDFSPRSSSLVYENVRYIAFRDTYGDTEGNGYYQQRWNSQELDLFPPVRELLPETADEVWRERLYGLFGIESMLDKHVVLLSSGELRKLQLTKTLLTNPRVLIMDNPFIGLDAATRDALEHLLAELSASTDLMIVLVLSKTDHIPDFITHVVPVEERVCGEKMTRVD